MEKAQPDIAARIANSQRSFFIVGITDSDRKIFLDEMNGGNGVGFTERVIFGADVGIQRPVPGRQGPWRKSFSRLSRG